ncbi:MAG: 1-deoxy-D-xylulose-5-phosphate reductoisomerase [Aquificaceae bacterium]|nr:1-deoxy-D-xylulose-5-phosphate reductoisomerase [Aquificaceae bacterium]MCX8059810.1 1-deoxy-D-xylulose-5-phosphate reductoisomerase [Aquificaceae bacterium]MDW8097563.1 1-deoxy-D-xylulose-5-phosphate reductoisomerase [Aquificaceae bacterium]
MRLGVLGSTGSVGSQTLQVVKAYREEVELVGLMAKRASQELLLQARELRPRYVSCHEEPPEGWLSELPPETTFLKGEEGLYAIVEESEVLMNAVSGTDGILPTHLTLSKNRRLLASNKESLICLPKLVSQKRELIVPVDSEHNAIFQLLSVVERKDIKKVYLTASGGPFRNRSLEELKHVTVEEALQHPTWRMGAKITVDSATLMNKGMELIEAMNLFDLPVELLDVLIHPQSVVHGLVELQDGNFLLLASQTDMRLPILYSLFYPQRRPFPFSRKSLFELSPIEFEKVDVEKFRSVPLCKWVALMGGPYPAVLVGADQIAVELFLQGRIGFLEVVELVEEVLSVVNLKEPQNLQEVLHTIEWAYQKGKELAEVRR